MLQLNQSAPPRDPVSTGRTELVELRRGSVHALVRPDWADALLGDTAPDWMSLESDPRAIRVKGPLRGGDESLREGHDPLRGDESRRGGRNRSIWRVTLGERTVFAKRTSSRGIAAWLARMTWGDSAQREWSVLRAASDRGIAVASGLALLTGFGRSVLITEAWSRAQRLSDAWNGGKDRPVAEQPARCGLIEAAAELFASAHDRGFVHRDSHPQNIVVQQLPGGSWQAVFVDVHGARMMRGAADMAASLQSLAQLDQYFQRRASRTDRLRFLHRYLQRRGLCDQASARRQHRRWVESLIPVKRAHAERLARRRDRRLSGNNRYFAKLNLHDGWRAHVALQLERRHVFPEVGVPDRSASDWRETLTALAKQFGSCPARRASFDAHTFHVEWHRLRGWMARFRALMLGSPHRRAFRLCHRERHRDGPVPLVLAVLERRRFGLVAASILVRPGRGASVPDSHR